MLIQRICQSLNLIQNTYFSLSFVLFIFYFFLRATLCVFSHPFNTLRLIFYSIFVIYESAALKFKAHQAFEH